MAIDEQAVVELFGKMDVDADDRHGILVVAY